jgi:hypothetical protein
MTIKFYNKEYEFKDETPEEVLYYFRERIKKIPKEVYYQYKDFWPRSKKLVYGDCEVSGKYTETKIYILYCKIL